MARGRMLSKKLSTSRKFAMVGQLAGEFPQLLYALLVPHCDDFGRQPGDAFTVKHEVFPTSPRAESEFESALIALEEQRLIARYDGRGQRVLQVENFDPHQQGLHKRTKSEFPEPPPSSPGGSGNIREIPPEQNRTEQKGSEANQSTHGAADASRFPQVVKKTTDWKRAIAISHAVIEGDPKNPHNWSAEVKGRLLEQEIDPNQRGQRGGKLFADALEYVINERKKRKVS